MKTKTTTREIGEFVLTKQEYADHPLRYTPRHYSVLNEEHSLGVIEGLEVYVGIDWLYSQNPNPKIPDHASFFEGYTKEELSRYKAWESQFNNQWYRYRKTLHEKQRWGFVGIHLASFINGIQVGETEKIKTLTEIGYAPSLNTYDLGNPIYLDETGAIANWVENNQEVIKKFAEDRRLVAFEFIKDTMKKLNR